MNLNSINDPSKPPHFLTVLDNWIPPCNGVTDQIQAFTIFKDIFGAIIPSYINTIAPIRDVLNENGANDLINTYEMISSGAMCYFGILTLALSSDLNHLSPKVGQFISLYLLVDYVFDDPNVKLARKRNIITYLRDVLSNTIICIGSDDPYCHLLGFFLQPMIEDNKSRDIMLRLFNAEVDSIKIQTKGSLPRAEYLSISRKKGGLTLQAIKTILGGNATDDDYELGACIQLVDDLLDTDEDNADGIMTIATYDIKNRPDGILDSLAVELMYSINALNGVSCIFKISLLILVVHAIGRLPHFSPAMKGWIEKYNWIPNIKLSISIGQQLMGLISE